MTPDEQAVERVARAIAHARSWQTTSLTVGDWDDRSKAEREPFLELARSAIAALAQPKVGDGGDAKLVRRGLDLANTLSCDVPITVAARRELEAAYDALERLTSP